MDTKICLFCGKKYSRKEYCSVTNFKKRKYCSIKCSAKDHRDVTIKKNKDRRKYPEIKGLSRQQICYRYNHALRKKALQRDRNKRIYVIKELGGKCVQCGYKKDIRALQLDHKNGDGSEDRKKRGAKIARYYSNNLKEAKKNLQVLCANCNKIKQIEYNEFCKTKRIN